MADEEAPPEEIKEEAPQEATEGDAADDESRVVVVEGENTDFVVQEQVEHDPEDVDALFGADGKGEEKPEGEVKEEGEGEEKPEAAEGEEGAEPKAEETGEGEPGPEGAQEVKEGEAAEGEAAEGAKPVEGEQKEGEAQAAAAEAELKADDPRMSVRYQEQDRYDEADRRISGDFVQKEGSDMFARTRASFTSLVEEQEEEEKISLKSIEEVESVEEARIDREAYTEIYKLLMKDYPMMKLKNNFLQRKMAEYFKRRKMEHVLRESEHFEEAQVKYDKILDKLWELRNLNNMKRDAITAEVNDMINTRDNQVESVTKNFQAMQSRERDIGTGLIFTKTAKEIPEKFLERLLKNQAFKCKEIEDMRLTYIKIRDNVTEIQTAIRAMDKIGENYTLIDFEQLKMENQNHSDKIEERDEELAKLRLKCSAATQCLAHFREKTCSIDIQILEASDKLDEVELERADCRERVNNLKQARDNLRADITKLQEDSGLLTKPKLLINMEEMLEIISASKEELNKMQQLFHRNAMTVEALKKNIEEEKEKFQPEKFVKKKVQQVRIKKRRPKLYCPPMETFHITEFEKE